MISWPVNNMATWKVGAEERMTSGTRSLMTSAEWDTVCRWKVAFRVEIRERASGLWKKVPRVIVVFMIMNANVQTLRRAIWPR